MHWPFPSWLKRHVYKLAPTGSEEETVRSQSLRKHLLGPSVSLFFVLVSFLAGRMSMSMSHQGHLGERLSIGTTDNLFQYNHTFAEPPSAESNAAWETLFPQHGGFFVHPKLAPHRSALSVFHQLHCLNQLRHGYYDLHTKVMDGRVGQLAGHGHSLPHIRHCIDLLRQSLQCNADLTIEPKNEELGGVTGFGTHHQCVDWPALMTWIVPYEGTDAPLRY